MYAIKLRLKYLAVFICIYNLIIAQGGVDEPGKYKPVSNHYLNKYYKRFYKAPKPYDTLVKPQGALTTSIWRIIDVNQGENKYIFYGNSKTQMVDLFEIIKFGLITGKINAFRNEEFSNYKKNIIPISELNNMLMGKPDTIVETFFDSDGIESTSKRVEQNEVSTANLEGFVLKEDWYMDKHFGKVDKRIIGLCPVVIDKQTNTSKPLFWLFYNECRQLFASFEAKNNTPDVRISFDELFLKRNFNSVISKHSNVFDRKISAYKIGQDTYFENEEFNAKLNSKDFDFFHN